MQIMSAYNHDNDVFFGLTREVLDMLLSGYALVLNDERELLIHRDHKGPVLGMTRSIALVAGEKVDSIAITAAKISILFPDCPFFVLKKEMVDLLVLTRTLETRLGVGTMFLGYAETTNDLVESMSAVYGLSSEHLSALEVLSP